MGFLGRPHWDRINSQATACRSPGLECRVRFGHIGNNSLKRSLKQAACALTRLERASARLERASARLERASARLERASARIERARVEAALTAAPTDRNPGELVGIFVYCYSSFENTLSSFSGLGIRYQN